MLRLPERSDINAPVNEQLIVELYSPSLGRADLAAGDPEQADRQRQDQPQQLARCRTAPLVRADARARSSASVVRVVSSHSAASLRNGIDAERRPRGRQHEVAGRSRARSSGTAAPKATPVSIAVTASRHDLAEHGGAQRPLAADDDDRDDGDDERDRGGDQPEHDARRRAWRSSPASASGTSVNVISAVRCDHSSVTSRMPTIGSSRLAGSDREREHVAEDQLVGLAEDAEQRHDGERERGDDQLQPEAGAGVDHLAQLDERQAGERSGFMPGPP